MKAQAPAKAEPSEETGRLSRKARDALFAELGTCAKGLTQLEADSRLRRVGSNDVAQSRHMPCCCHCRTAISSQGFRRY